MKKMIALVLRALAAGCTAAADVLAPPPPPPRAAFEVPLTGPQVQAAAELIRRMRGAAELREALGGHRLPNPTA
jgi:hypothetical protein